MHRQFAHPPVKKLKSLLQAANLWKDEYKDLLEDIDSKCDLCKRYSKTPPRPVVSMPMATSFNETVAMDLKQLVEWTVDFTHYRHVEQICHLILYKQKNFKGCNKVMGSIMTDNGGEFSSDEMREVMLISNVKVIS